MEAVRAIKDRLAFLLRSRAKTLNKQEEGEKESKGSRRVLAAEGPWAEAGVCAKECVFKLECAFLDERPFQH